MDKPFIIDIEQIGSSTLGYLSVAESCKNVPFDIKRVYWTYYTPNEVQRGSHAHRTLEQFIVAVSGTILFTLEDVKGNRYEFRLDAPNKGLYIPKMYWRMIDFSHNAVLLCLASDYYNERDYIRNYDEFLNIKVI